MATEVRFCPKCGVRRASLELRFCASCGLDLEGAMAPGDAIRAEPAHPTQAPHRALLDDFLPRYAALGYQVVARTDMTARLERTPQRGLFGRLADPLGLLGGGDRIVIDLSVDGAGHVVGSRGTGLCSKCGQLAGGNPRSCSNCSALSIQWPRLPA